VGLPLILSTGMSPLPDIDAAVEAALEFHDNVTLLHCCSLYPCPPEYIGLPSMRLLAQRYGLPVGYSGHETGMGPSVAAAALGACMIERHFTLDKTLPGSDHVCSLTPEEFAGLVCMVRDVEASLLVREKIVFPEVLSMARKLRKNLAAARDLPQGHIIGEEDVAFVCSGHPEALSLMGEAVGGRLKRAVARGEALFAGDFDEEREPAAPGESTVCAS
jgi:N-acetylneuraminate synthase/sialic acid synthase